MDQKQIEDIVRSVMASMGQPQTQPQPAASTPACHAACASEAVESCALDWAQRKRKPGLAYNIRTAPKC
jgi:ethanolamine ammonia-lyase small subunit